MATHISLSIFDFAAITVTGEASSPTGDRILSGAPVQTVRNLFADSTGQFFAGTWSSTTGRWQVRYTENEFCHVLTGIIRITDEAGRVCTFGPGASFVVPAGFTGQWEVVEPATKVYAIFESAKPAPF